MHDYQEACVAKIEQFLLPREFPNLPQTTLTPEGSGAGGLTPTTPVRSVSTPHGLCSSSMSDMLSPSKHANKAAVTAPATAAAAAP